MRAIVQSGASYFARRFPTALPTICNCVSVALLLDAVVSGFFGIDVEKLLRFFCRVFQMQFSLLAFISLGLDDLLIPVVRRTLLRPFPLFPFSAFAFFRRLRSNLYSSPLPFFYLLCGSIRPFFPYFFQLLSGMARAENNPALPSLSHCLASS